MFCVDLVWLVFWGLAGFSILVGFWLVVLELGDLLFLRVWVCGLGCSAVSGGDCGVGFLCGDLVGLVFRVSLT